MLPSTFVDLPENEKAFIIAAIETKIKNEKEAIDKAKREAGR